MDDHPPDDTDPEPSRPAAAPVLDTVSLTALRAPAVRRLLALRAERRLTRAHVHTTAQCLEVSEPHGVAVAGRCHHHTRHRRTPRRPPRRPVRDHPERSGCCSAYWHGNASAVHRELVARARRPPDRGHAGRATPPRARLTAAPPGSAASQVVRRRPLCRCWTRCRRCRRSCARCAGI